MKVFNEQMDAVRQSRLEGALLLRFAWREAGEGVYDLGYNKVAVVDDDEFSRLDVVLDEGSCPLVCLAGTCLLEAMYPSRRLRSFDCMGYVGRWYLGPTRQCNSRAVAACQARPINFHV